MRKALGQQSDLHTLMISEEEVEKFGTQPTIRTADDLWEAVGQDFDRGIHEMARRRNIDETRLLEILSASGEAAGRLSETPSATRFLPEASVLSLAILFGVLAAVVLRALLEG